MPSGRQLAEGNVSSVGEAKSEVALQVQGAAFHFSLLVFSLAGVR